jgi:hypothetical protein
MLSAVPSHAIAHPTVSFSTLAKLMSPSTPVKQASLLRDHKYPAPGPKFSYRNAREQLIAHAVHGTPFSPLLKLRPHELDAIRVMMKTAVPVPGGMTCFVPPANAPRWTFHGVDISVFPDVDLSGPTGLGALKAYFPKERLARGVGPTMAALLFHYKTQVLGQKNVSPRHCVIYEVRTGSLHACTNPTKLLPNAKVACQLIAALWPTL